VAAAEFVNDEARRLHHVLDNIPSAVFQGVQQRGPVPENARQAFDVVHAPDEFHRPAGGSDPFPYGFGAVRFS